MGTGGTREPLPDTQESPVRLWGANGPCVWEGEKQRGKADFITEICQSDSLIVSFIFLSNTSH